LVWVSWLTVVEEVIAIIKQDCYALKKLDYIEYGEETVELIIYLAAEANLKGE
jgi:hypothetical protein